NTDVYKLEVATTMTGIAGLRLEALTDPSLAGWGPGRQPVYHNFVLTELDVRMRPGMPQILEHPEFLTVAEGDAAGFSVDVESRFPVTYQWFYNGDAIEDQTNATLLVDP